MSSQTTPIKELTIIRIFNAPRERVFKAWIDPVQFAAWWGPKGFTNPVCKLDVRPGGAIYDDMTGPDGTVYPMGGTFREIVEPQRLVFTTTAIESEPGVYMLENLNTVTFEELDGKTKLTLHVEVLKATPEAQYALDGMNTGWSQSIDKLEQFVTKQ